MIKPDCAETCSLRASGFSFWRGKRPSRRPFLVEIDALYADVIVQRWEQFTGQNAERIAAAEEAAHAEG